MGAMLFITVGKSIAGVARSYKPVRGAAIHAGYTSEEGAETVVGAPHGRDALHHRLQEHRERGPLLQTCPRASWPRSDKGAESVVGAPAGHGQGSPRSAR